MCDRNYIEQYNAMRTCIYTATNKCDYDPYLMHYGVLGQKWGQHLMAKTKDAIGRRTGKKTKALTDTRTVKHMTSRTAKFASRVQNRMAKQQEAAQAKAEQMANVSKEQKKAYIANSRSAALLYKNADLFTTEELRETYNRLALEKQIKDLAMNSKQTSMAERLLKGSTTAVSLNRNAKSLVTDGVSTYNTIAAIYNTFSTDSKMTPINLGKDNNLKKKDDDDSH